MKSVVKCKHLSVHWCTRRKKTVTHILTPKAEPPMPPFSKPKESQGTSSQCTRAASRVQAIEPSSHGVLQAVDMRILYSDPDVLSPSNCYQYQFTNINNHLFPSGPLFPDRLCTFCVSWSASVWVSIKLLAALKLLTVIKNDLDVILYP